MIKKKKRTFSVFELIIVGAVAFVILMIWLSFVETPSPSNPLIDVSTIVINAVNSPTGIVLKSRELTFPADFSIDVSDLQKSTNLSENCFEFESSNELINTNMDKKKVTFSQGLRVVVYAQCITNQGCDLRILPSNFGSCCNQCVVSFGSPPLND